MHHTSALVLLCMCTASHAWTEFSTTTLEAQDPVTGSKHPIHTMTGQLTEEDEDITHTVSFADAVSGATRSVTLEGRPVKYLYSRSAVGYTPLASYGKVSKVCATTLVQNNSLLFTDIGFDPYSQTGADQPSTPLSDPDRTGETDWSGSSRRLLWEEMSRYAQRRGVKEAWRSTKAYAMDDYVKPWRRFYGPLSHIQFDGEAVRAAARKLLGQARPNIQTNRLSATGNAGLFGGGGTAHAVTKTSATDYNQKDPNQDQSDVDPPHGTDTRISDAQQRQQNTMLIGMTGIAFAGAMWGPGGALAAGFAFDEVCQHHWAGANCGGGGINGDTARALQAIGTEVDRLVTEVGFIAQIETSQFSFNSEVNNEFFQQNEENRFLQKQIEYNTDSVVQLQAEDNDLLNATQILYASVARNFDVVRQDLYAIEDGASLTWNATREAFDEVDATMNRIFSITVHIQRLLAENGRSLTHLYRETFMRRQLIAAYWKMYDTSTPQESYPLLSFTGQRPLSDAQIDARETVNQAALISAPRVQRTIQVGANFFAQQYTLSFKCSPVFAVDKMVIAPSILDLMDFLNSEGGCYPGDPDATWSCTCVVVVEYDECQIAGTSTAFPWAWGNFTTLPDQGETGSLCTGPITQNTINSGGGQVLETRRQLEVFLQQFCTVTVADGVTAADGRALRWFGHNIPRAFDQRVATTGEDSSVCDGSFSSSKIGTAEVIIKRPAPVFYNRLVYGAKVTAQRAIKTEEEAIYGKIPSDVTYWQTPFNDQARDDQTYRCNYVGFISVTERKLPIYHLSFLTMQKGLRISSEGQVILNGSDVASPFSWEATAPKYGVPLTGRSSSINMTTDTGVTVLDEAAHLLKKEMYVVGDWLDPTEPLVAYDVANAEICTLGSRTACAGRMTYLSEGTTWPGVTATSLFNASIWRQAHQVPMDVRSIGASPDRYKVQLIQLTPTKYVCGDMYDSDGTTLLNNTGLHDWCRILSYYRVSTSTINGRSYMEFIPNFYEQIFTVQVPGTVAIVSEHSVCPTNVTIVRAGNNVNFVLRSTSAEPISLFVSLADAGRTDDCTMLSQTISFSATTPYVSAPIPYIPGCEPTYLQYRTLHGGWCLPEPGMLAEGTYSVSSGIGVDPNLAIWSEVTRDQTAVEIASYMYHVADLMGEILDARDEEPSATVFSRTQSAFNQLADKVRDSNISTAAAGEALDRIAQDIRNRGNQVAGDTAAARAEGAASHHMIDKINTSAVQLAIINAFIGALNGDINRTFPGLIAGKEAMDAAIEKVVEDYINGRSASGSGGCIGGDVPVIGIAARLVCGLESALSKLFSSTWMRLLLYILIVVLCFWLFKTFRPQFRNNSSGSPVVIQQPGGYMPVNSSPVNVSDYVDDGEIEPEPQTRYR